MKNDLLCFSAHRWRFACQRPEQLMSRFARTARVFYIEVPLWGPEPDTLIVHKDPESDAYVVTPRLYHDGEPLLIQDRLRNLTDQLIRDEKIVDFVSWYSSATAFSFTDHLQPCTIVYDCVDELSAVNVPPATLSCYEQLLMKRADIVFAGGQRLFQAKKTQHLNIFSFPSALDKEFFYPARNRYPDLQDQRCISHPRLGFLGVLDKRFDFDLLDKMAALKPGWQFPLIGPLVNLDPAQPPLRPNIHYLGPKDYKLIPAYISGWDLCIMPFVINGSTEFYSPSHILEFLAAGKRVIATPIPDIENPYGADGLVGLAETAEEFIEIAEHDLKLKDKSAWLGKVDHFLWGISWERTWKAMVEKIEMELQKKLPENAEKYQHCV